jgi:hypothetical protein
VIIVPYYFLRLLKKGICGEEVSHNASTTSLLTLVE